MAGTILTPVTLWKDFDDSLPLKEDILSEQVEDGALYREIYILGRQTEYGRVKIYAKYYTPVGEKEYPAVMIFFEAGFPCDLKFVNRFIKRGYAVLCVDYCGDMGDGSRHTIYPRDVDYANFLRADRRMKFVDDTAKETSWYEWAAVARYAARYLAEKEEVTSAGAIGLRTGGEILWKIAPYAPLSCLITVCAAGWLAYLDVEKFGSENRVFNEERHRFIAGLDSQSYAPHVKCPVLLLSAINDKKSNYDRVYDTFQLINPEVEKAILYSAHGNGLIGTHSLANVDLFLDKFLKGRSVYLSKPVRSSVFTDESGVLKVQISYDTMGDPEECGVFYSEKISAYKARDWTRLIGGAKHLKGNAAVFPLDVFVESEKVLIYSFVRYSNGFSVTSKIQEVTLKNPYRNSCSRSRILYSADRGTAGFSVFRRRASSIADCFTDSVSSEVELRLGYGGIPGACCSAGLISYRVSEPRFEPSHGAAFLFDAYCAGDAVLNVVFYTDEEETEGYSCALEVEGGGKWKKFVCESGDFKSEKGVPLPDFGSVVSVVFLSEEDVLVNNVIWL